MSRPEAEVGRGGAREKKHLVEASQEVEAAESTVGEACVDFAPLVTEERAIGLLETPDICRGNRDAMSWQCK